MKVRLQMMIQDPRFAPVQGAKRRIEGYDVTGLEFTDGPATDRVAVVDIDAATGDIQPGATFIPPPPKRVRGRFDLPKAAEIDVESPTFIQVSVMATVLKTIALYESPDVLGRPVRWGFDDPQIMVVPRAGRDDNAFYSRLNQRLEFGYFSPESEPSETVFTSLSRDIVAHETGHAILDGIAPQLLDLATETPQSLALHEAIGDVTGLLIAISSDNLRREVLSHTQGSIDDASYFSGIGEEFGMAAKGSGALRNLYDKDYAKVMGKVDRAKPHNLSEVLTAALYSVLVKMHNKSWNELSPLSDPPKKRYSKSGLALFVSSERFKRMTLRALDYLPPGQITFADYARAVIAADQASHPDDKEERQWIVDEFDKRGIVGDKAALTVTAPNMEFGDVDLGLLVQDDAAARAFAEKYRMLLSIPETVAFTVAPRLVVCKKYYHRSECDETQSEPRTAKECLFKVWWSDPEHGNRVKGTTLSIHWNTQRLRVLLTSDHSDRPGEEEALRADLAKSADHPLAIACLQ